MDGLFWEELHCSKLPYHPGFPYLVTCPQHQRENPLLKFNWSTVMTSSEIKDTIVGEINVKKEDEIQQLVYHKVADSPYLKLLTNRSTEIAPMEIGVNAPYLLLNHLLTNKQRRQMMKILSHKINHWKGNKSVYIHRNLLFTKVKKSKQSKDKELACSATSTQLMPKNCLTGKGNPSKSRNILLCFLITT